MIDKPQFTTNSLKALHYLHYTLHATIPLGKRFSLWNALGVGAGDGGGGYKRELLVFREEDEGMGGMGTGMGGSFNGQGHGQQAYGDGYAGGGEGYASYGPGGGSGQTFNGGAFASYAPTGGYGGGYKSSYA